jgi:hypothetical protein
VLRRARAPTRVVLESFRRALEAGAAQPTPPAAHGLNRCGQTPHPVQFCIQNLYDRR